MHHENSGNAPAPDNLEAKARADGFRELYGWLDQRDVLIVKADRQEALVVVRLSLAVEIAQTTNPKVEA